MGRFNRGKGAIIDSVKHEVRFSNLLETGGGIKFVDIATAKNTNAIALDTDVKTGAVIKAIFFELNFNHEGNITATVDWQIAKVKPGQTLPDSNPSIPNEPTRSQTFLWGMEMPAGINNSSAVKRTGILLIPKGKQRMSEGDIWRFSYFSGAGTGQADTCGHFIYKEYR